MIILKFLQGKIGWVFLTKLRDSLISKAISAITISTFVLSNYPDFLSFLSGSSPKMLFVLLGGLVFVSGYIFCLLRAPAEFKGGRDVPTIVGQMLQVSTFEFLQSRMGLLDRMIKDPTVTRALDMPNGRLLYAQTRLASCVANATEQNWREFAGSLYDADLKVREFADVRGRFLCFFLFATGLLFITLPTLKSLGQVLFSIF